MNIGIDALHYYVPQTYLPISDLAAARGIEYPKLNKGLGLEAMAIPDLDEDVATMAAQAALRLIVEQELNPKDIGRLYLGTESALDAAKATASYAAEILEKELAPKYGERCLKNCDVVDLTFACIGAVDALENALDYVRANHSRTALVVASDMAKYELASTGEYTQGAGAVAILVKASPRLLAFNAHIGVAMQSVNDFYKPRRSFNKVNLLQQAATLLGTSINKEDAANLVENANLPFWNNLAQQVELHQEEPVFDGPYSNDCYQDRIGEALENFREKQEMQVLERWQKMIFHLPYAFQGRRMITASWYNWMHETGHQEKIKAALKELNLTEASTPEKIKGLSKSPLYKEFVRSYLAQGEKASSLIGNMYTASIFMSLLSLLKSAQAENEDLSDKRIGFFAYGSGSKAKVLEAQVQPQWKEPLANLNLFDALGKRHAISFSQYEKWHKGQLNKPMLAKQNIKLERVGTEGTTLGYRYYS